LRAQHEASFVQVGHERLGLLKQAYLRIGSNERFMKIWWWKFQFYKSG